MVNFPKSTPTSTPSPVPDRANDTGPLVITCADADSTAPACASPSAYEPSTSLILCASEQLPLPWSTCHLPAVKPPPDTVIWTGMDWPFSQETTPLPLACL